MPAIEKSAEHLRIEGLVKQFPAGTRKGDDARTRLADIEKKFGKDVQRNEGKGQFVQQQKIRPSLQDKIRAKRGR